MMEVLLSKQLTGRVIYHDCVSKSLYLGLQSILHKGL